MRRFYPFVPFVGALVLDGLAVCDEAVPEGTMLLDAYGQNHDPDLWDEPFRLVSDRFLGAAPHPDGLIPQGGGPRESHRCPGEDITLAVLTALARGLARLDSTLPEQDPAHSADSPSRPDPVTAFVWRPPMNPGPTPDPAPDDGPEPYDATPFLPKRGRLPAHRRAAADCRGCPCTALHCTAAA